MSTTSLRKFGDFTSKETSDGKAYIEFNERDTKTRSAATKELSI